MAYRGSTLALRDYFRQAVSYCETPKKDASGGEVLHWTLETLLVRFGDKRFAAELEKELPRNRSAIGHYVPADARRYPRTAQLLKEAPAIVFPMDRANLDPSS
jgi:hypothetical protein